MKNIFSLLLLVLFFTACKEKIAPGLDLGGGVKTIDSTYTAPTEVPQQKTVLIEELTGVGCQACPDGARTLKSLIEQNNGNAVLVALHSGSFSEPYAENKYDFRNNDADQIANSLGLPPGYPSASITRTPDVNGDYFLLSGEWNNRISEALKKPTALNIHIEKIYNEEKNELELVVRSAFTEDISEDLNLFIYIAEDNIIDFQKDKIEYTGHPQGYDFDYEHNHVFRACVTNVLGDPLNFGEKKAGNVLQKRLTFNPIIEGTNKWNLDNCHIVAFVAKSGNSREVLHAQEVKLK